MLRLARVTLVIPDELAKELRMKAVEVYGGQRGWLGMAVTDAGTALDQAAHSSAEKIGRFPEHSSCTAGGSNPTGPAIRDSEISFWLQPFNSPAPFLLHLPPENL